MEDVVSPAYRSEAAWVLVVASGVLAIGTASIDAQRVPLLLVPLSFLLAAYGAGAWFARVCGEIDRKARCPVFGLVTRLGLGVAGLSFAVTLMAMGGGLWFTPVVVLPSIAVGLRSLMQTVRNLGHGPPPMRPALAGLVLGAAWLVAWLWATIPPTFFDELVYHLVIPQRALATGRLEDTPWVFYTLMPHASDVLLAWGMAFAGDLGARATHFSMWIVCSLAAWALAHALAGSCASVRGAALAVCALAASPTVWFLATLPFAELWLATAVLISSLILVRPDRYTRPWLALGLLLGLAATLKLTGLVWVAAALAAALVVRWTWTEALKAGLAAWGAVLPWWLRAFRSTGNPVYPLAYRWLGGTGWNDENQARLLADLPYGSASLGAADLLCLPFDILQHPEQFGSAGDAGAVAVLSTGVLLAMPVLSRLARRDTRHQRWGDAGAVFVLIAGTCWVLTTPTVRFFAPVLALGLASLAAIGLRLRGYAQAFMITLLGVAGVLGAQSFLNQHMQVFSSDRIALGRETRHSFLSRNLEHFHAAEFVRAALPPDARVLFIGETRPYHFARAGIAPSAMDFHPLSQWVAEASSPETLAARLAEEEITHVVLNVREFHRLHKAYGYLAFRGQEAEEQDRRLKALPRALKLLFQRNGVYVFEVPRQQE